MSRLTVGEILTSASEHFRHKGVLNPRVDAEVLLAHVLGVERIDLYVNYARPLNSEETAAYRKLVARRLRSVPVAYLVGHKEFMGLDFKVDENVLIPRPETEHLVEAVSKYVSERSTDGQGCVILDMCTGSGAVGISLAVALVSVDVVAVDVSPGALRVARSNAEAHGVADRVHFLRSDMFEKLAVDKLGAGFDVVVSNPPYLSEADLETLQSDIAVSEPMVALYGGVDGMRFHRILVDRSSDYLKPGGVLVLEIGASQGSAVADMLQSNGAYQAVTISKDYAGYDRVVTACKR